MNEHFNALATCTSGERHCFSLADNTSPLLVCRTCGSRMALRAEQFYIIQNLRSAPGTALDRYLDELRAQLAKHSLKPPKQRPCKLHKTRGCTAGPCREFNVPAKSSQPRRKKQARRDRRR